MPVKAGPNDAEGRVLAATIPVSAKPAGAEARKRYVARMVTKAPKIDGKLDERGLGGGAVDGRRSSTR